MTVRATATSAIFDDTPPQTSDSVSWNALPVAPDRTAPRVQATFVKESLTTVLRRRGIRLRLRSDEPARVTLEATTRLRVRTGAQRRARLRTVRLGSTTIRLTGTARRLVRIPLTRSARRTLARRSSVRVAVRLRATDPAGNRRTTTVATTLRKPRRR